MQDLSPIFPSHAGGVVVSPLDQQFTPPLPSSQRPAALEAPAWSRNPSSSFGEPRLMEQPASSSDGHSDTIDPRASWSSQGSITPAIPNKRRTRGSLGELRNSFVRRSISDAAVRRSVDNIRRSVDNNNILAAAPRRSIGEIVAPRRSISSGEVAAASVPVPRRSVTEKKNVVTTPRQATRGKGHTTSSMSSTLDSSSHSKCTSLASRSSSVVTSADSIGSKKSTTHKKRTLQRVRKTLSKKSQTSLPKKRRLLVRYFTPCHEHAMQKLQIRQYPASQPPPRVRRAEARNSANALGPTQNTPAAIRPPRVLSRHISTCPQPKPVPKISHQKALRPMATLLAPTPEHPRSVQQTQIFSPMPEIDEREFDDPEAAVDPSLDGEEVEDGKANNDELSKSFEIMNVSGQKNLPASSSSSPCDTVQTLNGERRRFSISEVPHSKIFTPVLFERVGWKPFVQPTPVSSGASNHTARPKEPLCHVSLDCCQANLQWCVLPTPEIMAMSRSGPPPEAPQPEKMQTLQSNFTSRLECAANAEPSPPRDSPCVSSSVPALRTSVRSRGSVPRSVEMDKQDVLSMLGPSPMSSPSASPTGSPELSSVTPAMRSSLPAPTPVYIPPPTRAADPSAPAAVNVTVTPAAEAATSSEADAQQPPQAASAPKPAKVLSIPPPRVRPPSDAQPPLSVSRPTTSATSSRKPAVSSTWKAAPTRPLPGRSSAPTCSPVDHASFPDKGPVKIEDLDHPRARTRSHTVGSQQRPFSPPSSQECYPDDEEETRKDLLYRPQIIVEGADWMPDDMDLTASAPACSFKYAQFMEMQAQASGSNALHVSLPNHGEYYLDETSAHSCLPHTSPVPTSSALPLPSPMSVVSDKENINQDNVSGKAKAAGSRGSIKDHVFAVPTAPVRKVKDTALTPVPWRKVDGYNRKGVMRYTPRMATPNSVAPQRKKRRSIVEQMLAQERNLTPNPTI